MMFAIHYVSELSLMMVMLNGDFELLGGMRMLMCWIINSYLVV